MSSDDRYTYETADAAMAEAKRYCKRDGLIWIMQRKDGRFVIICPYAEHIKQHYTVTLGWTIAVELESRVFVRTVLSDAEATAEAQLQAEANDLLNHVASERMHPGGYVEIGGAVDAIMQAFRKPAGDSLYKGLWVTAMENAAEAMDIVQQNPDWFDGATPGADKLAIVCREFVKMVGVTLHNSELEAVLHDAVACFDAAACEGWSEALAEGDIERLRDLWVRRIAHAYEGLTAALPDEDDDHT